MEPLFERAPQPAVASCCSWATKLCVRWLAFEIAAAAICQCMLLGAGSGLAVGQEKPTRPQIDVTRWPMVLTDEQYKSQRDTIKAAFASLTANNGVLAFDERATAQAAFGELIDALKANVDRYGAADYGEARSYLELLQRRFDQESQGKDWRKPRAKRAAVPAAAPPADTARGDDNPTPPHNANFDQPVKQARMTRDELLRTVRVSNGVRRGMPLEEVQEVMGKEDYNWPCTEGWVLGWNNVLRPVDEGDPEGIVAIVFAFGPSARVSRAENIFVIESKDSFVKRVCVPGATTESVQKLLGAPSQVLRDDPLTWEYRSRLCDKRTQRWTDGRVSEDYWPCDVHLEFNDKDELRGWQHMYTHPTNKRTPFR